MMQRNALQDGLHHLGGVKVRVRKSFSYEASTSGPDLEEQILKLRAMKNSPYRDRSLASIAGMILSEYVPKEIDKYERRREQSEG